MSTLDSSKQVYLGFILAISVASVSCVTSSNEQDPVTLAGTWTSTGLRDITVNNLTTFEGNMYAATDSGLYQTCLRNNNISWNAAGLQINNVVNITFLHNDKLLAAVRFDTVNEGKPTLFLSRNNGQSWQPWLNNFGGETGEYTHVSSITSISKPSDTLFAQAAERTIARTINGGRNWKIVNGDWNRFGGAPQVIYSDLYYKGRIWATGATPFGIAYLLVSEDYGENWKNLKVGTTEQICYDIISHPQKHNIILVVLAGRANQVRKSKDLGQSWNTVFEDIVPITLTNSKRNSETVYASGRSLTGTLFFAPSPDFGDTWQIVEMEDGPAGVQVNDIVSVMQDGHEVLYLGTNQGVYSYQFEK